MISGECASTDSDVATWWVNGKLPGILGRYVAADVYNTD